MQPGRRAVREKRPVELVHHENQDVRTPRHPRPASRSRLISRYSSTSALRVARIGRAILQGAADVEAVDHGREPLRDPARRPLADQLAQIEDEIAVQPIGVNAQQSRGFGRILRLNIEGEPRRHDVTIELLRHETCSYDSLNPLLRRFGLRNAVASAGAEFAKNMPHRGEQDLVLGAEIMMCQSGRDTPHAQRSG